MKAAILNKVSIKLYLNRKLQKSMNNNIKGIFLDDIRIPSDLTYYIPKEEIAPYLLINWTVVRNYQDFVAYISQNGIPSIISFDHDLGVNVDNTEAESGYDAVKYIVDLIIEQEHKVLPQVLCHSQNPVGKTNILSYWKNFIKTIDKG